MLYKGLMVRVDIVFEHYNSQLQVIRGRVLRAFLELGLEPHWHEWDLRQKNLPDAIAAQSSLAVLVDGEDVLSVHSTASESVYRFIGFFDGGVENLPSVVKIRHVMKSKQDVCEDLTQPRLNHWLVLTVIPIILSAFFFDTICAVCGAQFAGVPVAATAADLKHILGFLFPVVLFSLFFAISGLIYRAKERHGYKPLVAGGFGLIMLFYGRFIEGSQALFWLGAGGLTLAALWNAHLKVPPPLNPCPRCPAVQQKEVGTPSESNPQAAVSQGAEGASLISRF